MTESLLGDVLRPPSNIPRLDTIRKIFAPLPPEINLSMMKLKASEELVAVQFRLDSVYTNITLDVAQNYEKDDCFKSHPTPISRLTCPSEIILSSPMVLNFPNQLGDMAVHAQGVREGCT